MQTDACAFGSHYDFPILLEQLSVNLDRREISRLKFLCMDIIPMHKMERMSDGVQLMEELQKRKRLSSNKVLLLNQLLYKIGRHDLLRMTGVSSGSVERTIGHSEGIPRYRMLLHDLAEHMTNEDIKRIKRLCHDAKVTNTQLKAIKTPRALFSLLEACGIIRCGDLCFLEQIFRSSHRGDLLAVLGASPCRPTATAGDTRIHNSVTGVESTVKRRYHHAPFPPNPALLPTHSQPTQFDSFYKMTAKPRGVCLIINNEIFTKDPKDSLSLPMDNRKGTHVDCRDLEEVFKKLKFIVKVNNNLTDVEIVNKLKKYGQRIDHTTYDCFVCCLLTHGKEGKVFGSNGKSIRINVLLSFFNAENSKTLLGKPKIFFINACQGTEAQKAVAIETNEQPARPPSCSIRVDPVETDSIGQNPDRETIPHGADFLLGYASLRGYVSFRSTQTGSWYINALCELLTDLAESEDLLSILTEVNKRISQPTTLNDQKQCPAPVYTLRKKLFLCDRTRIER